MQQIRMDRFNAENLDANTTAFKEGMEAFNKEFISSVKPENGIYVPNNMDQQALLDFKALNDVKDSVYKKLIGVLGNDYYVNNVEATYISNEDIENMTADSKIKECVGYTISELKDKFQDEGYIISSGENGETEINNLKNLEKNSTDKVTKEIIKNVAIGAGAVLVCVTVSMASAGVGAGAVSLVFVEAAKEGTVMAISSGLIGGVTEGIVKGVQTHDFDEALKSSLVVASKGVKWGAITGIIHGGASEYSALKGLTLNGLSINDAVEIQKESGYPAEIISRISEKAEYGIYKKADLYPEEINGKLALSREIDFSKNSEIGRINRYRIEKGLSPIDKDGNAYQLHHIGQESDSPLAILTYKEHLADGNKAILHKIREGSTVEHNYNWNKEVRDFWKAYMEAV